MKEQLSGDNSDKSRDSAVDLNACVTKEEQRLGRPLRDREFRQLVDALSSLMDTTGRWGLR